MIWKKNFNGEAEVASTELHKNDVFGNIIKIFFGLFDLSADA